MADITLSADQATEIITEAKKDKIGEGPVYPGNMPESPDKRVEIARELVSFAIDAYVNDNMRGVEVTDILSAAHVSVADDGTVSQNGAGAVRAAPDPSETVTNEAKAPALAADEVVLVNSDGVKVSVPEEQVGALEAAGFERYAEAQPDHEPDPEPTDLTVLIGGQEVTLPIAQARGLIASGAAAEVPVAGAEAPPAEPAPQEAGGGDQPPQDPPAPPAVGEPEGAVKLEEPWPGYDKAKDTEVRAQMEGFTDEEIRYVKDYEAQNKNRQRIANFKRKGPVPTGEQPQGDPGELDAAKEAEAAAERDTAGEDQPRAIPRAEFEPIQHDHLPILTAHEERALALAEVEKSRLPIPNDEIGSAPEFPEDIAGISDGELWTLHSQFNACLALANWKLGLVQVDEKAFRHIADAKVREVRADLDTTNPATGKPKGQEALDREAEGDERVQAWREKQYQAELRAIPLRRLVDIYSSHVEVLSRQWTFREREVQSSGGLAPRS